MKPLFLFAVTLFVPVLFSQTMSAKSDEIDVRKMLPATTAVYVEAQSIESILKHPFTATVKSSSAFKKILRSPDVLKLLAGMAVAEFAIGDKVEAVAASLTANGLHFAVDRKTEGVVVLACTESTDWIEEYLQKLVKLARSDAKSKNQPDPVHEADYRGIHGYEFQKLIVGNIGSTLIVTNKKELGKSIIDRHLDSTNDHLLSNALFQQAWKSQAADKQKDSPEPTLRAFVDINTLRQAGVAKDLLMGKAKDFGGELILGGVLATMQKTSFAIGELFLSTNQLSMQFCVPHEKEWTEESRTFFVGPKGSGYASSLVDSSRMMASLSAYRNLAEMWLRAGDLFDEKVNDQLAQADNTLTTLFSGKDFGTDILGAVEPQIQLVAVEQIFEKSNEPAIRLPSFGMVAKLKDATMRKELKRTFQSFIGFLNVAGAMEGNPQLDLDSETIDGKQIYTATYLQDSDKKYENGLPIQFNFSPTLAFEGDLVYITSTNSLAKQLRLRSAEQNANKEQTKNNTLLTVDFGTLKQGLEANRNQLISQNILEKGHSRSEAEKEIDALINLLSLLKTGNAALRFDDQVKLTVDLEIHSDR
jgi:hypothetical protein